MLEHKMKDKERIERKVNIVHENGKRTLKREYGRMSGSIGSKREGQVGRRDRKFKSGV